MALENRMKKSELLKSVDASLLDSLFGFCYARTQDSCEARELCSDIVFELAKAAGKEGELENPYAFIWQVARNVYATYKNRRRRQKDLFYQGDAEEVLTLLPAWEEGDDSQELLRAVFSRIAFLTRAYREVMIQFYIEGKSTEEIAGAQGIGESAVRQRLFEARKKLHSQLHRQMEPEEKHRQQRPDVRLTILGMGNPNRGDPRLVCNRRFSEQIMGLCGKKPRTAAQIAEELGVPTVYVEEELEILEKGQDGRYGLLQQLGNGMYAVNFILFDRRTMEEAVTILKEHMGRISGIVAKHMEEHRGEYLAYPYLNHKVASNQVMWQHANGIQKRILDRIQKHLAEHDFRQVERSRRPFTVYGYEEKAGYGSRLTGYGSCLTGYNAVSGKNVCGFSEVYCCNMSNRWIGQRFGCNLNLGLDHQIQLALRAIAGLEIGTLSEEEKEHAAKAIEQGYLYLEGEKLYTQAA